MSEDDQALRITSGLPRFLGVTMSAPDDARLTVAQAAQLFGVTKAAVNNWYLRGHLKDVTFDSKGQRLYLFRELCDAERKTRRHPNSHRNTLPPAFAMV